MLTAPGNLQAALGPKPVQCKLVVGASMSYGLMPEARAAAKRPRAFSAL